MIVEGLVDLFYNMFLGLVSGLEFIGLPYQVINVLNTILCYGVWVIGADVLSLFAASVVTWWGIKFVVGVFVFVWELLPLT